MMWFESHFPLWIREHQIDFSALPAHTHKKAATVERSNRVAKDILERLDVDNVTSKLPFIDKLSKTELLSNIMYGNRTASALEIEMAKGYTPRVCGTEQVPLPDMVREVQEELAARRLFGSDTEVETDCETRGDSSRETCARVGSLRSAQNRALAAAEGLQSKPGRFYLSRKRPTRTIDRKSAR